MCRPTSFGLRRRSSKKSRKLIDGGFRKEEIIIFGLHKFFSIHPWNPKSFHTKITRLQTGKLSVTTMVENLYFVPPLILK